MTVATNLNRSDAVITSGTTVYPFTNIRIFADTDLVVTKRDLDDAETTLVLNTDYTVTGAGNYNGGSITVSSAYAIANAGHDLTIRRVVPLKQETDIRNQGNFFPETHEDVFDRSVMIDQQQQEEIDRTVKLPITVSGVSPFLPVPDPGKAIKWNDAGDGFANSSGDVDEIVATATALAGAAAQSASDAATEHAAVAAIYDAFDDRYLGAKASDPATDNDGNALVEGALYWNTVSKAMRVYSGALWTEFSSVAYIPFTFSGDGAATTFALPVAPVSKNNVFLAITGVDQTGAFDVSGTALTFTSAPPLGVDNIKGRIAQPLPVNSADAANVTYTPDDGGAQATLQDELDALNLADYAALRTYAGTRKSAYVTGYLASAAPSGIAGLFTLDTSDTTSADNGGTIIVDALGRRWKRPATGTVNTAWFGVRADLSTDDTTAIQAAINASTAGNRICFASGFHLVTGEITVPKGVILQGAGRGLSSGAGNSGGTVIRTNHATANVFHIQSLGGVTIRDMSIDASVVKTAGSMIYVEGDSAATYNSNSTFENLYIGAAYVGVRIKAAINWILKDSLILDFQQVGVYLSGEGFTGSNGDDCTGHSAVQNCVIWALNTTATADSCVRYDCGGDFRVLGCKLLGAAFGLRTVLNRGPTGTLIVEGNSFEEQRSDCIRVTNSGTTQFGNIVIVGNQFSILVPTTHQNEVVIVAGSALWVKNVTINSNVFNSSRSTAFAMISVQDGSGVVISGNVLNNNGVAGAFGISTGGNATNVQVADNQAVGLPSGMFAAGLNANTKVQDFNGITFAALGGWANGSQVYVTDGTFANPVAGGGTGCIAKRLAGAWRGD